MSGLAVLLANDVSAQESVFDFFKDMGGNETERELYEVQPVEPPVPPHVDLAEPTIELPEISGDVYGLVGAWTITTDRNSDCCTLNGTAQIAMTPSGGYTCELVMRDFCRNSHDGIIRQSCLLEAVGDGVFVEATVLEALYGPLSGYSPDDFLLERAEDGSFVGNHEGYGGYPAVWRRTIDGIS